MNRLILITTASLLFLFSGISHAICVRNDTKIPLRYEIYNQNTTYPIPKEKFHSGILLSLKQKNCHAHSANEGADWKIYRHDLIRVYRIDNGAQELVCNTHIEGILKTLKVKHTSGLQTPWGCLSNRDHD